MVLPPPLNRGLWPHVTEGYDMESLYVTGYWGYRGALAVGNRTEIPRTLTKSLEQALWAATGFTPDNKSTFLVEQGSGPRYISFYDDYTYIGDAVEIGGAVEMVTLDLDVE